MTTSLAPLGCFPVFLPRANNTRRTDILYVHTHTRTQRSRYESFQTKKCRILLKKRKGLILREVSQSLIHCFQNIFLSAVHCSHHIHHSYSCQCWKLTLIVLKCRDTSSFSCMWCVRINRRLILVFVCLFIYLFLSKDWWNFHLMSRVERVRTAMRGGILISPRSHNVFLFPSPLHLHSITIYLLLAPRVREDRISLALHPNPPTHKTHTVNSFFLMKMLSE